MADDTGPGHGGTGAAVLAPDAGRLVQRASGGDLRALARLVSLIENGSPELRPIMRALAPLAGGARVIGLTGSPGVGKSTITGALVKAYRARDQRVGVIAVDPSSPFTGGALLGDRIRMQDHATDTGCSSGPWPAAGTSAGWPWPPRRRCACWTRPAST